MIGYTNVGKSALLNALNGKEVVKSKNFLFMTLNTKAKRIRIDANSHFVGVDTVGFISDLPTNLG